MKDFLLVHICFSLSLILFWSNNLKFEICIKYRILNKLYVDVDSIKLIKFGKKIDKLWKKSNKMQKILYWI